MVAIYTPSFFQPQNINGVPLAGAKLYFYQTGTTTPITVYQDSGLTTPHANPVVADASGIFAPIYTSSAEFKTVLKTSADVTVQTVDPVFGGTGSLTSTDHAIARYDGTNGTLQNSLITIDDTGVMSIPAQQMLYTNATVFNIMAGTLDGADTSQIKISGGGAAANTRGGFIVCYGNEVGGGLGGKILMVAGLTATGNDEISLAGETKVTGSLTVTVDVIAPNHGSTGVLSLFAGTNNIALQPNGKGVTTGQTLIATSGNMTVDGSVTADSFTGSAANLTNIGTPIAALALGSLGSYAMLLHSSATVAGALVAGSSLRYSGTALNIGGTPAGTWRCMGEIDAGAATVFLRSA